MPGFAARLKWVLSEYESPRQALTLFMVPNSHECSSSPQYFDQASLGIRGLPTTHSRAGAARNLLQLTVPVTVSFGVTF